MTNNWWFDFKSRFFGAKSAMLPYIGINIGIFVLVAIFSLIGFLSGYPGAVYGLVDNYMAFPSAPNLWLSHCYTIITYQFFHASFFHILFNMLWLYWMGQLFLDFLKPRQFHFVYLGGGIMGAVFYALIFNLVPAYARVTDSVLIGASAAVMAIFAAVTTLVPNYSIRLLFVGELKIKYLLAVYIFLDIIAIETYNGGSLAHLGGAFFGFVYIKLLQQGTDLTTIFKRKPKLKVVRNEKPLKNESFVNQKEVDAVLDKISKSGYEKLTKEEKDILFRASKN